MKRHLPLMIVLLLLMPGCARFRDARIFDLQAVESNSVSDADLAKEKHSIGLDLLEQGDLAGAEQLFQASLIADKSYGPAHNSLGAVYHAQKNFFMAAWEYELAEKTMPGRAEPINNLGLVYETVGQTSKAVVYYQQASEIAPENPQYLGNLIRARIRRGDKSADLRPMLENLIFLDNRTPWVIWAKGQLTGGNLDPGMGGEASEYLDAKYEIIEPLPGDGSNSGSLLTPIELSAPNDVDSNR